MAEKKEALEATTLEAVPAIEAGKPLLVETERYLKAGVHIGTRYKSGDMARYIYKKRRDGLKVLDIQTLDERIRLAAQLIAKVPADQVMIVSRKLYGQSSAKSFAECIGAKSLMGRFVPGSFTNPGGKKFIEPKLLIATEPESDKQAIDEASKVNIPTIAFCSTNNSTQYIDLVIPANNKGRKSLALVYWLLARETLKARGDISKDSEFSPKVEDFEYKLKESDMMDDDGFEGDQYQKRRGRMDDRRNDRDRGDRGYGRERRERY